MKSSFLNSARICDISQESNQTENPSERPNPDTYTPEEDIEIADQAIREGLATELLHMIHSHSPRFFERLVIDLLVRGGFETVDASRGGHRASDKLN